MTALNRRAIRASRELPKLRREVNALESQVARLNTKLRRKLERLELGEQVDLVHRGVALAGDGADWEAVDESVSRRWTVSYVNVRDGGVGLYLREWLESGGYRDVRVVTSQPEDVARERALLWVVKGELPGDVGVNLA